MRDTTVALPHGSTVLLGICGGFERAYGMSSKDFYKRYLEGEFVGIHDASRWAGYWRKYLEMRRATAGGNSGPKPRGPK